MVSDNYFDLLGVTASRGQLFREGRASSSSPPVAVISHEYWMSAYAGDPSALGARFRLDQREFTIVGVAVKGFRGATLDRPIDVWVRLEQIVPPGDDDRTRGRWVYVLGRLQRGQSRIAAEAEAAARLGRPVQWLPGGSGFSTLRATLSRPLLLLWLVVGLVLLITCANLANLALAGSAARERELAVRSAIGASRARIIRQLATEGVVLSFGGTVLAFAVAPWTSVALLGFLPPADAPALRTLGFVLDVRTLAFVALVSVLTTVLFGLLPAFSATRGRVPHVLKAGPGGGRRVRTWTSRGLVVLEVTLCTLLLVVAGVFVRTVQNLRGQDAGYQEDRLLVADVQPPFEYPEVRRDALIEALRQGAEGLSGVEIVAFSNAGQLSGGGLEYGVALPGEPMPRTAAERGFFEQRVSPGFLPAMGTRFIAGRDITAADDERSQPVAVVNEAFVRRVFKGADPVSRTIVRGLATGGAVETRVVGVVRDSKWINLRDDAPAMYYIPYRQKSGIPVVWFVIRASGDLQALGGHLVRLAQSLDRQMTVTNVVPFREIVNRTLVIERLVAHVSTAFALLGLLISSVGLYGLLAYAVVRRRREIGVRMAIGATRAAVAWMLVRESLGLLLAGVVLGVPAAVLVTRLVSSLLFGLAPGDPGVISATAGTLAIATLAATWAPARRAAGTDPIQALRED
jgi:predicted permease